MSCTVGFIDTKPYHRRTWTFCKGGNRGNRGEVLACRVALLGSRMDVRPGLDITWWLQYHVFKELDFDLFIFFYVFFCVSYFII